MKPGELIEKQKTVPAEFLPWPLFVLNEEHEGAAGEPLITETLEAMRRVGFGGIYIHPRPGLLTEYLSERWFELIRHCVRESMRLGMVPNLYDENSYPSGFGGGHVPVEKPETRAQYVTPIFGSGPAEVPGDALSVHAWENDQPGETLKVEGIGPQQEWVAFQIRPGVEAAFHGDGPYVSLCDPQTTPTFLSLVHERYRAALNDDEWAALGAIFTDEPHLTGKSHGPWDEGLHLTPYLVSEFENRVGYDLRPHVAALYFDLPESPRVRHDFYELVHFVWLENWAKPLHAWCQENGLKLTGHYLEHDWPDPYATPGHVHLLAHMDWPGTDFLECFGLLGAGMRDPQNFNSAIPGREPHALYYLKQVLSVANQFDRERVMDESWGAGGHDSTPADWARIGRFLAVHGVNQFCPHYTPLTISGARKQDHPQFFGTQSPWFDYLRPLHEEIGRLSWLATRGTAEQRILLLDPLTTAFCKARKADCLSALMPAPSQPPLDGQPEQNAIQRIREAAGDFAQDLSDTLFDFDMGDEFVIEEFGAVEDRALVVGQQRYPVLVWPPEMTNLRRATVERMDAFLERGGRMLGIRPTGITVNGRESDLLADWDARHAGAITWFDDAATLRQALAESVPPRVSFDKAPETGLALLYRRLSDADELYMLVNSHPAQALDALPRFSDGAGVVAVLDPATGVVSRLAEGESLKIPPTEARVLLRGEIAADAKEQPSFAETGSAVPVEIASARAAEANVLAIDTCALEAGGEVFPEQNVYFAHQDYWRIHGMPPHGWLMRVQYKQQFLQNDKRFGPETGGTVRYRFHVGDGLNTDGMRLAVERPELWTLALNGEPLDFADARPWRDIRICSIDVGERVRPGENVVEMRGAPFQVRHEIDVIYVIGDFDVVSANVGHQIVARNSERALGSWRAQGMPFYDQGVDYHLHLPKDAETGYLRVPAAAWSGAVIELRQGKRRETSYGPDVSFHVDASEGDVALRVIGLPKNLFGPWHPNGAPQRKRGWAMAWSTPEQAKSEPEPGANYDLLDLGLLQAPTWTDMA